MMSQPTNAYELMVELDSVAESSLHRHIALGDDWHPHEYVPWSQGENFQRLGGRPWSATDSSLSSLAQSAMILNLLTEDNLPTYHYEVRSRTDQEKMPASVEWIHRWTAEEARHAIVMRDYLVVTRAVDPVQLEQLRMTHVAAGNWEYSPGTITNFDTAEPSALVAGHTYTCMQEMATRISHRNTGVACNDPLAEAMLTRIAKDENLHMLFYRNLVQAAFDLNPDQAIAGVYQTMSQFAMPGVNIPGFRRMAVEMAWGNIYNVDQHYREVLLPLVRVWNLLERTDYSPNGEVWRDQLASFLATQEHEAARFLARQEERALRLATRRQDRTATMSS